MQIHEKRPDAVMIFVAPPSIEELERRLVGRGTENPEKVAARMKTAEEELKQADKFDYIIVNDDLDCAIADLLAILRAERCRNSKL